MGLYEELDFIDILTPVQGLLKRQQIKLELDGTIDIGELIFTGDRPWINCLPEPNRRCGTWLSFYFKYYRIVPRGCRNCWKVCFTGRIKDGWTLDDLFKLREVQDKLGIPGKCGVERRAYTGALGSYRAFWYAPLGGGLAEARQVYREVKKAMGSLRGVRNRKSELILKRGCTEMEHLYHPSSTWDRLAEERAWDLRESLLNASVRDEYASDKEPTAQVKQTERIWIEYAFEHGDSTYMNYKEGPMVPPHELYQESSHADNDFRSTWTPPQEAELATEKSTGVDEHGSGSGEDSAKTSPKEMDERGSTRARTDGKPNLTLV